jgi:hypothetical protein
VKLAISDPTNSEVFYRPAPNWRVAVTVLILSSVILILCALVIEDLAIRIVCPVLAFVCTVLAVLCFAGRKGWFKADGEKIVWRTGVGARKQLEVDLRSVLSIEFKDQGDWYELFATLTDGSRFVLPTTYIWRARHIAEFMDFVKRTNPDIRIVGRDLLPS